MSATVWAGAGMLILALMETPFFLLIGGLSVICYYAATQDPMAWQAILIEMNRLASMPVLVALPLFTFVGTFLTATEAPRRIMDFMQALVGWMPGGLAVAALCSCAFFTALTGASGVTIVALGGVLYPILRQQQYPESFSLGLLTTSGSRGLLFPPSLPIILYGVVAQVDISKIFQAAMVPGILSILLISAYSMIVASIQNKGQRRQAEKKTRRWEPLLRSGRNAIWDLPIVLIIVVGVYGGYVTIAEVSAVVLVYVVVVECFVLKEVHLISQLPGIIVESAILSGSIIIILGFSLGFTGYLVDQQIPNQILSALTGLTESRILFLAALNAFLLIVGCVMDIFSAIVIIVPIMAPIAITYGVDPIHLCIVFMVNLEIGYSTPPIGMNLFIAGLKFRKPITRLYLASFPFLVLMVLFLILVTYFPAVSLFSL